MEDYMNENQCSKGCEEKCVPFFDVQNTMMHYNWANRRMLIALLAVCITMIAVVIIFASNQTKREQMWQETIKSMYASSVTEVSDGEQNANP
jgi:hypothetical protein